VGEVVVVRHGATEWTVSGRHTGRTDIPLTDDGRTAAIALRPRLAHRRFALVLTSPLSRARETCALAGFEDGAVVEPDLVEWDYGEYEGRTTTDIRGERPGWTVWRDGVPGGETVADVAARVDRVIARARAVDGDVLVFGHGHCLRVLGARWVDFAAEAGAVLAFDPARLSVLGWEWERPVIREWNAAMMDG
jgi:broad specificity phosphatase PhoE